MTGKKFVDLMLQGPGISHPKFDHETVIDLTVAAKFMEKTCGTKGRLNKVVEAAIIACDGAISPRDGTAVIVGTPAPVEFEIFNHLPAFGHVPTLHTNVGKFCLHILRVNTELMKKGLVLGDSCSMKDAYEVWERWPGRDIELTTLGFSCTMRTHWPFTVTESDPPRIIGMALRPPRVDLRNPGGFEPQAWAYDPF